MRPNDTRYEDVILTPPGAEENNKAGVRRTTVKRSTKTAKALIKLDNCKQNKNEDSFEDVETLGDNESWLDIIDQTLSVKIRWRYRISRIDIMKVI